MCQLKALDITKEQCIMGFKAILHLCQVAAGKRVPTWLVAAWQRTAPAHRAGFYLCETHSATTYVQIDTFLQANLQYI